MPNGLETYLKTSLFGKISLAPNSQVSKLDETVESVLVDRLDKVVIEIPRNPKHSTSDICY